MTFEEWQATKRRVEPPTLIDRGHLWYPCVEGTEEVWLYAGNLVIEIRPGGRFMLQLPGEEEVANSKSRRSGPPTKKAGLFCLL